MMRTRGGAKRPQGRPTTRSARCACAEYTGLAYGSGDSRPQSVVGPGRVISGAGYSRGAENKVGVRIHIAAIDVDDVRFLHDGLSIEHRQFHPVIPRFHLESEPTGIVR